MADMALVTARRLGIDISARWMQKQENRSAEQIRHGVLGEWQRCIGIGGE